MSGSILAGRVAIVTGANAGIGTAIAVALANEGAAVLIHYLAEALPAPRDRSMEHTVAGPGAAEELVRRIRAEGGRAECFAGDLSRPETAPEMFDFAERALGSVGILVNNAAHCELPDTILEATADGINRHFRVNTTAPVLLTRELARRIQSRDLRWGRVINISTAPARAFPTQIAYGASKAALEAFTRSTAIELGPLGITVNAIAPGPVQTGYIDADMEARLLPWIPLGRLGSPEEIADAVLFFASDRASWITGQVLAVSGGHAL